jgi:predicted unusual protein kinase regulating ubiquinone biosynthesis (AarF/ABC1/UbiB family)
MQTKYDLYVIK